MGTSSRYFLVVSWNVLKSPEIRPCSSVPTVKTRQFRGIAACSSSKLPSQAKPSGDLLSVYPKVRGTFAHNGFKRPAERMNVRKPQLLSNLT